METKRVDFKVRFNFKFFNLFPQLAFYIQEWEYGYESSFCVQFGWLFGLVGVRIGLKKSVFG